MTDAPERIARIIRENLSGVTSADPDIRAAQEDDLMRTAKLIAADLCASGQQVRALKWRAAGHDGQSLEASAFGVEVAYRVSGKPGDWTLTSIGMREYIHTPGYETRADAQAAAQVDYERRILAALTPAPQPEGQVQCCMCGRKNLSTTEGDGGEECQLWDGRWTCSRGCYDQACAIHEAQCPPQPSVSVAEAIAAIEALNVIKTGPWCGGYISRKAALRALKGDGE